MNSGLPQVHAAARMDFNEFFLICPLITVTI